MNKNKRSDHKIFTGVAGEYYVAAELSRRNWITTVTLKNTKGVDILASSADRKKFVNIQVKTGRHETGGFIVGSRPMMAIGKNYYYIFVLLKNDDKTEYWIIPQSMVVKTAENDWRTWIKGKSLKSTNAPRTLKWRHLKSKAFEKYHNNWKILDR